VGFISRPHLRSACKCDFEKRVLPKKVRYCRFVPIKHTRMLPRAYCGVGSHRKVSCQKCPLPLKEQRQSRGDTSWVKERNVGVIRDVGDYGFRYYTRISRSCCICLYCTTQCNVTQFRKNNHSFFTHVLSCFSPLFSLQHALQYLLVMLRRSKLLSKKVFYVLSK